MDSLVRVNGVYKAFGPVVAVDGIHLAVPRGEVLGFLGPNGAGKSTAMRMIAGFLTPDSGSISVCGHDVSDEPLAAKTRIGYLPEGAPSYGDMSCHDFLTFVAKARGLGPTTRKARIAQVVETVSLGEVLRRPIETLSKGFKRRVGLAQAILHDPDVLVLDEPTDGLDPNQKHQVRELIAQMAADKAIIISTHILEEVEAVCSRAVVIARGRIVADGTAEDLLARLPNHNAALVTVPDAYVDNARAALSDLPDVGATDVAGTTDGHTTFRVMPGRDGKPPVIAVANRLGERGVAIESLTVDRGRLDEVFRRITLPGADAPHATGRTPTEAAHA